MARSLWVLTVLGVLIATGAMAGPGATPVYAQDCDGFLIQSAAQNYLRALGEDTDQLDGPNDNGVACEELPCPCDTDPIAGLIGDYVPPTATATATATRTPVPTQSSSGGSQTNPTATSTPTTTITTGVAAATATSAAATATAITLPAATSTVAPPPAIQSVITPPSTGDGGLLR